MTPSNVRLILHPSLPWLLLLYPIVALPAASQVLPSESSDIKVQIDVEAVEATPGNFLNPPPTSIPPADLTENPAVAPVVEVELDENVALDTDQAPEEQPKPDDNVARNLATGQALLDESKYLTVPGPRGSALNAYRMALVSDSSNAVARNGIQAVLDRLVLKARQEHASGNDQRARTLLESASGIVEPFVNRSDYEALLAAIDAKTVAGSAPPPDAVESEDTGAERADDHDSEPHVETASAVEPTENRTPQDAVSDGNAPEIISPAVPAAELEGVLAEDEPSSITVAALAVPPVYHVGRRLRLEPPEHARGALRWMLNEFTIAEGNADRSLDYTFVERDLGQCRIVVYEMVNDGEPAVIAEAETEVRIFEDNSVAWAQAEEVVLDPTRHGPVEGAFTTYEWRIDNEIVSTEPVLQWSFDDGGRHRVECRMSGPLDAADQQWPAPVLAWTFDVAATDPLEEAVAASEPAPVEPAFARAETAPTRGPGRQTNSLLVILSAAVVVLAVTQVWMAYRLNSLSRAAVSSVPQKKLKTTAELGSLPPEEEYLEELHQRFRGDEPIKE